MTEVTVPQEQGHGHRGYQTPVCGAHGVLPLPVEAEGDLPRRKTHRVTRHAMVGPQRHGAVLQRAPPLVLPDQREDAADDERRRVQQVLVTNGQVPHTEPERFEEEVRSHPASGTDGRGYLRHVDRLARRGLVFDLFAQPRVGHGPAVAHKMHRVKVHAR